MRQLLTSSAAAAALMASGAAAQEWSAKVGGFFTGAVAVLDIGQDGNDFGIVRDSEVHFDFELVADNGLTFGTHLELEVADDDGNADFDEAFASVSGAFGRIEIGEADGAADGPKYSGDVGADFVRAADATGLLFDYYSGSFDNQVDIAATGATTDDSLKISYYTPEFSGFSAGVSWAPSLVGAGDGTVTSLDASDEQNAFELGAQWTGEFSGVSIVIGAGWASDTVPGADDDSSFAGGAAIGYAGFEIGANYGYVEEDESDHFSVGVSYATGPWKVGADYGQVFSSDDPDREDDLGVAGGVSYALAPGVVAGLTLEYAEDGAPGGEEAFASGLWLSLGY